MNKIRVNFMMPEHLHEYVKELASSLGIPASTMYIMIVNLYKDNSTAVKALKTLQEAQEGVNKSEITT